MNTAQRRICLFLIISNEFCERFCYYGFRSLLFIFMRESYHFTTLKATWFMHLFNFMSYFFTFFGGILSDYVLGRYKTILYLTCVYLLGTLLVTYSAINLNLSYLIFGLILISFGTGGIKPSVSTFGGDQFKKEEKNKLERFFNIFYFWINAGSTLSMFYLPLLAKKRCFGRDTCYPLSFFIPSGLLLLSLVLFYSGSKFYIRHKPDSITLIRILRDIFPKIKFFKDKNIEKSFHTNENIKELNKEQLYNESNLKTQDNNIHEVDENLDKEDIKYSEAQINKSTEKNEQCKDEELQNLYIKNTKFLGVNQNLVKGEFMNLEVQKSNIFYYNEVSEDEKQYRKSQNQNIITQVSNENFENEGYNEFNFNIGHINQKDLPTFNDLTEPSKTEESEALNNETQLQEKKEIILDDNKSKVSFSFLKQKYGDKFARDIKKILNLLKVFSILPIFWMLYDQQTSSWVEQASKLSQDIKIFSYSYHLPPSQMQALNPILILVFIPLFTYVLYPLMYRYFKVTSIHKMSLGILFASLSFILASFISFYLNYSGSNFNLSNITLNDKIHNPIKSNSIINSNNSLRKDLHNNFKFNSSFNKETFKPPSILWQIPQYILITMGEILLSTTVLHFGYLHSPPSMRSLVLSLYLLTVALGNLYVMVFTTLEVVIFIRSKYAEGLISLFYAFIGIIGSFLLFKCKNSLENKSEVTEEY
ncbi:proton-dependent oligopeptide transporter [Hamiltosporidium tvaerminnensis]|uniref:Proton-dependent oligopeptide transporter n=1 Tax=Hamiltosporidium tvaerminnensis TaxID=1176355 RepID=A0A4Q9M188_9MICR|nr:proton-dependent oligopeptide transporter [Hamiltosporidium tvaerminnensis]